MFKKNSFFAIVALALGVSNTASAMNILQPYDTLIRPPFDGENRWQLAIYGEAGIDTKAYNEKDEVCDVLRIWQTEQNALAMLQGAPENAPISLLREQLDADDNGTRGQMTVCSDFDARYSAAISARVRFLEQFSFAAYLPFMSMKLTNVCWRDQTQEIIDADIRVKELLMGENLETFFNTVRELGNDLDLGCWERSGVGDLTLMLEWLRDFPQQKPMLKNVHVNARLGLGVPTSKRADEDKLFALPFGNNGATSLIFGAGLDLKLGSYFKAGVDVQLTHLFGNTREQRIKTDINQTELLLLNKARVYTDYGLTQRFNLHIEAYKIIKGFSFKVGYQYRKRGENKISLVCNDFSDKIANTARRLDEFTMHHVILNARYSFEDDLGRDAAIKPYISLYARLPFNGKRVALERFVGAVFAIDF